LQLSLQEASPETFGCTLISQYLRHETFVCVVCNCIPKRYVIVSTYFGRSVQIPPYIIVTRLDFLSPVTVSKIVAGRIVRSKIEEATLGWRKLRNEGLHCYWGEQEDEMGRACSMEGRYDKYMQNFRRGT